MVWEMITDQFLTGLDNHKLRVQGALTIDPGGSVTRSLKDVTEEKTPQIVCQETTTSHMQFKVEEEAETETSW